VQKTIITKLRLFSTKNKAEHRKLVCKHSQHRPRRSKEITKNDPSYRRSKLRLLKLLRCRYNVRYESYDNYFFHYILMLLLAFVLTQCLVSSPRCNNIPWWFLGYLKRNCISSFQTNSSLFMTIRSTLRVKACSIMNKAETHKWVWECSQYRTRQSMHNIKGLRFRRTESRQLKQARCRYELRYETCAICFECRTLLFHFRFTMFTKHIPLFPMHVNVSLLHVSHFHTYLWLEVGKSRITATTQTF
jgi:hypothetical protein